MIFNNYKFIVNLAIMIFNNYKRVYEIYQYK